MACGTIVFRTPQHTPPVRLVRAGVFYGALCRTGALRHWPRGRQCPLAAHRQTDLLRINHGAQKHAAACLDVPKGENAVNPLIRQGKWALFSDPDRRICQRFTQCFSRLTASEATSPRRAISEIYFSNSINYDTTLMAEHSPAQLAGAKRLGDTLPVLLPTT